MTITSSRTDHNKFSRKDKKKNKKKKGKSNDSYNISGSGRWFEVGNTDNIVMLCTLLESIYRAFPEYILLARVFF